MLYVKNLKSDVTEEQIREKFEPFGKVERVKKVKDYAFIHFDERDKALSAMQELNNTVSTCSFTRHCISGIIFWAKSFAPFGSEFLCRLLCMALLLFRHC